MLVASIKSPGFTPGLLQWLSIVQFWCNVAKCWGRSSVCAHSHELVPLFRTCRKAGLMLSCVRTNQHAHVAEQPLPAPFPNPTIRKARHERYNINTTHQSYARVQERH